MKKYEAEKEAKEKTEREAAQHAIRMQIEKAKKETAERKKREQDAKEREDRIGKYVSAAVSKDKQEHQNFKEAEAKKIAAEKKAL